MLLLLNNPVWNGLTSGNRLLANGNNAVKYFDKEVSPLIGMSDYSQANFDALYEMIPAGRVLATVSTEEITIPQNWKVIRHIKILQMVFDAPIPQTTTGQQFVSLQKQHVPGMMALTKLTNPGPFAERTIDFGNYEGIFSNGELIAMAGQRMQPLPYIEISAVCTHPNHHGKGYAGRLITSQIQKITALSGTPFLHVRGDNETAIKLYQKLGFYIRTEVHFNMIQKN